MWFGLINYVVRLHRLLVVRGALQAAVVHPHDPGVRRDLGYIKFADRIPVP